MKITHIKRIKDYAIFRDFTWPGDLDEFGRYNLIYGWNGSGKTLLSRIFRHLENKTSPTFGNVTLSIDGHDFTELEFPQTNVQIKVFNRDFVNESIFPVEGGDLPPIYVIGKENVQKQKKLKELKAKLATKKKELDKIRETKQKAEKDLDNHCIVSAKRIKDLLRASGSAYNDYNKGDYRDRAEQMAAEGDAATHPLSDSQRENLLVWHRAEPESKVAEVDYRLPQLQDLADKVAALLETTVVSTTIEALKDDPKLARWTREGLRLHKDRNSDRCLFCEQPLPKDRLAKLEAHFNAEYERFLQKVEEQIQALESARKEAAELRLRDRAALYKDLVTEYDAAEQALRETLGVVQGFLEDLIAALKVKKTKPFERLTMIPPIPKIDTEVVDRLNTVIRKHNQACDNFNQRVSEARNRLATDMIAEELDEFVRLRDAVKQTDARLGEAEQDIQRLTREIDQLEREIVQHRQPAEDLNKDLQSYLGHDELQLEIKETGYAITRHGKPAKSLSEGERTAIALLYFLKSLEDQAFNLLDSVVVLDDPVSSLDANALYCAFGFIRERTQRAGQLFILTHNFPFFRQVRNWFMHTRQQEHLYMLECTYNGADRKSQLRRLDLLLRDYDSEYHYLFARVYRAENSPTEKLLEENYILPNIARRLLETFLAFKYPGKESMWDKLRKVKTLDESKKSKIFNFVNIHSHGGDVGQPEQDLSWLRETRSILKDILNLIQGEDSEHFSAMVRLVEQVDANSGNGE